MKVLAQIVLISTWSVSIAGWAAVSEPKDYSRRIWTVDDGLPQSTPLTITQTRDGYLWVGTYSGLARFDGLQFTSFNSVNTPELVADGIKALLEDRNGVLWIGTAGGGLVSYRDRQFHSVPAKVSGSVLEVSCMAEDSHGTLWVGANRGLFRLGGNFLESVPLPSVSSNTPVRGLGFSDDGCLWIGTPDKVIAYRDEKELHTIGIPKRVSQLICDRGGKIWIAFSETGGLGMIDSQTVALTSCAIDSRIAAIHETDDGILWVGDSQGRLFEASGPSKTNFVERLRISDRPLTCINKDRDGNIWAGLGSSGLCRLKGKIALTHTADAGLGTSAVATLLQDRKGTIWAGTFGAGVYRWTNGGFQRVSIGANIYNVTTLAETTDGALWFGTFGGSMIRQLEGGRPRIESAFGNGFRAVYADRDGGLWAAKVDGGCVYVKAGRKTEYTTRDGLANNQVFAIAEDLQGSIWIATQNGLSRWREGKFESFFQKDGLGGNDVRSLIVDSRGILWAGTSLGGLARFENGRFTAIRAADGLINDRIGQIVEDDHGNLWLGSMGGIVKVPLQELDDFAAGKYDSVRATAFRREEGLPANECGSGFQPSCLKSITGELWFATGHGIIVIDPKQIAFSGHAPPVHIEKIVIDGKLQLPPGNSGLLRVPPGSQRVEFRFTGVDLSAPSLVRFRHRLRGYDADWVNAGFRREAIYTHIAPGDYRFEVAALNNEGIWSDSVSLGVKTLPYYWQTIPFRVAMVMLVISAAALIAWRLQNRRFRKKFADLERQHALEIERARIAQDMHDGLGSSLVKISLLGDMVESRLGRDLETQPDLRRISETARQAVREMDEIVWAVNPKHDTLDSLAGYLGQFAQEHFAGTGIACHLEIPHQFPHQRLSAEVRHNLYLATREALNNILKHSRASQAWIRLSLREDHLALVIEDNGCGLVQEKRFGDGLTNMQERLSQVHGRTEIANRDSAGTTITFTLPLQLPKG